MSPRSSRLSPRRRGRRRGDALPAWHEPLGLRAQRLPEGFPAPRGHRSQLLRQRGRPCADARLRRGWKGLDGEAGGDRHRPDPCGLYPLYPTAAARGPLPQGGLLFDLQSYCFRHEPSLEPTRMQLFRMREYVRMGSPEEVLAFREVWLDRGTKMMPGSAFRSMSISPTIRSSVVRVRCSQQSAQSEPEVRAERAGQQRREADPPASASTIIKTISARPGVSPRPTAAWLTRPASASDWSASPSPCCATMGSISPNGRPTCAPPSGAKRLVRQPCHS